MDYVSEIACHDQARHNTKREHHELYFFFSEEWVQTALIAGGRLSIYHRINVGLDGSRRENPTLHKQRTLNRASPQFEHHPRNVHPSTFQHAYPPHIKVEL